MMNSFDKAVDGVFQGFTPNPCILFESSYAGYKSEGYISQKSLHTKIIELMKRGIANLNISESQELMLLYAATKSRTAKKNLEAWIRQGKVNFLFIAADIIYDDIYHHFSKQKGFFDKLTADSARRLVEGARTSARARRNDPDSLLNYVDESGIPKSEYIYKGNDFENDFLYTFIENNQHFFNDRQLGFDVLRNEMISSLAYWKGTKINPVENLRTFFKNFSEDTGLDTMEIIKRKGDIIEGIPNVSPAAMNTYFSYLAVKKRLKSIVYDVESLSLAELKEALKKKSNFPFAETEKRKAGNLSFRR